MLFEEISLTPQEILDKDFKIDTRGYRPQEVDKYLDTIIKRLAGLYTDREDIVNRFALLSGIVGRFRRAFVQMMKQ